MAHLLVYGNLAGRASGGGRLDEHVAPFNASIPNPLARVTYTSNETTSVDAIAQAGSNSDGTSVVLKPQMRINARPNSQAAAILGTTFTGRPDGAGTPIDVEIAPDGNEHVGDRVLVRFQADWNADFYSVNENQHRLRILFNVTPPTGFTRELIRQDFVQPLNDATAASGKASDQFEAQIGQRFQITALAAIDAVANVIRDELDYTDLTLNYAMDATFLGGTTTPPPPPSASGATIYQKNSNAPGPADSTFAYGLPGWSPLAGDWDGDGVASIAVFDPSSATFYERNQNFPGPADAAFSYGVPGWIPLVGDWDGDFIVSVGIYDPATATFLLSNTNGQGPPAAIFSFGRPGWLPVVGDWDGDGTTTIGVFDPSTATFYLRNSNSPGPADAIFSFGLPGWLPVVGDWDGDSFTTAGVFDPYSATYYLRNFNFPGPAAAVFSFGLPGWSPLVGDWDGDGAVTIGIFNNVFSGSTASVASASASTTLPASAIATSRSGESTATAAGALAFVPLVIPGQDLPSIGSTILQDWVRTEAVLGPDLTAGPIGVERAPGRLRR